MANINGSDFSQQNLDLARVYGLDESLDRTHEDIESLMGYNFDDAQMSEGMQDEAVRTAMQNANNREMTTMGATSRGGNAQQTTMNGGNTLPQRNVEPMAPRTRPQRQEQTFPTTSPTTNQRPTEGDMQVCDQHGQMHDNQTGCMNAFLRTQLGKNMSVQFLVGTNTLIEKSGDLMAVGKNYIILHENDTGCALVCDFDNIKFIRFAKEHEHIQ